MPVWNGDGVPNFEEYASRQQSQGNSSSGAGTARQQEMPYEGHLSRAVRKSAYGYYFLVFWLVVAIGSYLYFSSQNPDLFPAIKMNTTSLNEVLSSKSIKHNAPLVVPLQQRKTSTVIVKNQPEPDHLVDNTTTKNSGSEGASSSSVSSNKNYSGLSRFEKKYKKAGSSNSESSRTSVVSESQKHEKKIIVSQYNSQKKQQAVSLSDRRNKDEGEVLKEMKSKKTLYMPSSWD